MSTSQPRQTLQLPPIILGGSGFSYQVHPDPKSVPISKIIRHAFDVGIKAIDTSPYYDPSERLLGEALASPEVTSRYARSDYILMTKVGRISVDKFDYSPDWVRKSVHTSLERLGTTYLDAVFCHDIEYVTIPEAIEAVGALFDLSTNGLVRYVGVSGYDLDRLVYVAHAVREKYGRSLDVVQNWAQLTMQNTRLERYGIPALKEAQVPVICNSSPLASGLLRASGVPIGTLGDWHPSPNGLRAAVKRASDWTETQETTLAALALRFSIARATRASQNGISVHTILGICSLSDIEENVRAVTSILIPEASTGDGLEDGNVNVLRLKTVNEAAEQRDLLLSGTVRQILGGWAEYDFSKGQTKQDARSCRRE
ncbi:Aldo/keto reductase [Aspergillus minisclerotigenes]|uniref:Aldo/keto reductase n=1 Tax=Aspergillus minisclerotigenes TaxID=656917 RepID=A0A5N6IZ65_9EURO|nr:Aldo/keto reductase [Aspergillus minisclerotigenes]